MIAADEIIVPQAGQGISDSPSASAATAGFGTGLAAGAAAATCVAGFATGAGAGVGATGWGRIPAAGAGCVDTGFGATDGPVAAGAAAAREADCSWTSSCFSRSMSRFASSAT